jgi:aspartate dehydrogenase
MTKLIIGFGAIASHVVEALGRDPETAIRYVLCRKGREEAARDALGPEVVPVTDIAAVPEALDLAIECAGHAGLAQHGPAILRGGTDLLCASNGALASAELAAELEAAAKAGGAQLQLVSGAIGAVDAISAAAAGKLKRVVYRGRKPPQGWKGSPAEERLDLDALSEATAHFEGTAREAALAYPKNANVAATIALAGLGLDRTKVQLIADPGVSENIHEVEAEGDFGRLDFRISGNPLPGNPRSSALTAMSIVAAVRRRHARIVVGA